MNRLKPTLLLSFCAALAALFYLGVELSLMNGRLGFPLDDSWIHLQFAKNLAHGFGLSYNAGEFVTGSTAPLWTALLAILFLLPGNLVFWVKLLSIVLFVASILATYRLSRALGTSHGLATVAGLLTLTTYWLVWSALSGMEIVLFILLSMQGMVYAIRERQDSARPPLSWMLFGLAALLRPEAVLLIVFAAVDWLLRFDRRDGGLRLRLGALDRLLLGMLVTAAVVLPTLALFYWETGSILPTTFGAKTGSERNWFPNGRYLYLVAGIFIRPQPVMFLTAAAGSLRLFGRLGGDKDRGMLPALWLIGLPLAYSLLSPEGRHQLVGNFGRYYFPLFPVMIVLGVLGIERFVDAVGRRLEIGPLALPLRPLLLLGCLLTPLLTLVSGAGRYAQNVANIHDGDVQMGLWLQEHMDPRAVVAVQDIGAIKFFGGQRIIDLVGIASPDIQPYIRQAASAKDPLGQLGVLRYLEEKQPDYLVGFPAWHPMITGDRSRYRPVHRIDVEDNITLAGETLVVYRTPWARFPLLGESRRPREPAAEPVEPVDASLQ